MNMSIINIARILVMVNLAFLIGCKPSPKTGTSKADDRQLKVEQRRLSSSVTAFGTVQSASSSVIRAQSGGRVTAIHVERGADIKPGDVLLEVKNERYQRQRAEQEGKVRTCEWTLKKKELERATKQGADADIAQADVEIARLELASAKRNLDAANEDVENCTVKATFAGKVMSVDVKTGDLVSGSGDYSLGTILFQVVGSNDYVIEVSLGEVETARIDSGTRADVRLPAVFGTTFGGNIKSISQAARRSDRGAMFPVTVAFSSDDPRVKLGLSAEVQFVLNTKESALAVPLSAVHFDQKGAWVGVNTDGNKAQKYVKLGVNDASFVEIISGLKEGDAILQ